LICELLRLSYYKISFLATCNWSKFIEIKDLKNLNCLNLVFKVFKKLLSQTRQRSIEYCDRSNNFVYFLGSNQPISLIRLHLRVQSHRIFGLKVEFIHVFSTLCCYIWKLLMLVSEINPNNNAIKKMNWLILSFN